MSNIYFISDIHLDINNSEVTKRFLDFIDKKKSDMKELYILGSNAGNNYYSKRILTYEFRCY